MNSKIQNNAKPRKGCGRSLIVILFALVAVGILSLIRGCTADRRIAEFRDADYIVAFLNSNPTREDVYNLRLNASYMGDGRRENPDYESTTYRTTGWIDNPLGSGFVNLITTTSNGEPRFINNTGNRGFLIADTPRRITRNYLGQIWFSFDGTLETYGLTGFRRVYSNTDPLNEITLRDVKNFASIDWLQFSFDQERAEIVEILNREYGLNAEVLGSDISYRGREPHRRIAFYIENVRFEVGPIFPIAGARIEASLVDE